MAIVLAPAILCFTVMSTWLLPSAVAHSVSAGQASQIISCVETTLDHLQYFISAHRSVIELVFYGCMYCFLQVSKTGQPKQSTKRNPGETRGSEVSVQTLTPLGSSTRHPHSLLFFRSRSTLHPSLKRSSRPRTSRANSQPRHRRHRPDPRPSSQKWPGASHPTRISNRGPPPSSRHDLRVPCSITRRLP